MRMPINYLPGFVTGTNGNSGINWSNIKSNAMSDASNIILSGLEFGKDISDAFHYNKSVGNILNEQGYHFAGNDNFGY